MEKAVNEKRNNLNGIRVLLISLSGYSSGILKKMRELGADADLLNDKPDEGFMCKTLGRYQMGFYQEIIHDYYQQKLEVLKNRNYDYILSIRGEYTPVKTLRLLKKYFPNSRMILYMWDALHQSNTKGIETKWPFYDQVYTFDRIDYEAHKKELRFLPLFYYEDCIPDYANDFDSRYFTYDLSFIGTGHGDRIRTVKSVMKKCRSSGLNCFSYFFMPHRFVYFYNKITNQDFRNIKISDVAFRMMPLEKLYQIYADSKCIMDMENKNQHGLTMRTIEILGLHRKLITTNKDIVNYDFYNSDNIFLLDRENPVVEMSFFEKPYKLLDEKIYKKYSLTNWILEILH